MKTNKVLQVYYKERLVGTLAQTPDKKVAFEYAKEWLEDGFSISPFSLPLEKKVFLPEKTHFGGLYGVFADSLPDAWGNLLLNRILRKQGIDPANLNPLDRLSIVGDTGMGALSYRPENSLQLSDKENDFDRLAMACKRILRTEYSEDLDTLYRLGGTSGGARPKIMTVIDGEFWIVKFQAHIDGPKAGRMEYEYSMCARACGIHMPATRLFPSRECEGYFGVERFDRRGEERIHMLTAAALLELNHEEPSLDYHSLMKLTKILTMNNENDIEQMFRMMCFNVFARNRDDHSKNFTFLYDELTDRWRLSPAYDLTYSNTYYGEHATTVNGNGHNPSEEDLLTVGLQVGMSKKKCLSIINEIRNNVEQMLGEWIAKE